MVSGKKHGMTGVMFITGWILLTIPRAFAQVPPPYWYASFDDGYGLEGALADVVPAIPFQNIPKESIIPGIRGKAMMVGNGFVFRNPKLLPAPEGTISLWVMPVNWGDGKGKSIGLHYNLDKADWGLAYYGSDCYWAEQWPGVTGGWGDYTIGKYYKQTWLDNQWVMLTLVWRDKERQLYINDYLAARASGKPNNPVTPGTYLHLSGEGSRAVDSLGVWDQPLTGGDVAMLYYSQRPRIHEKPSYCRVFPAPGDVVVDARPARDIWEKATAITDWCDSFAGSALDCDDTVQLVHKGDWLYVLYREPMPGNYEVAKNILGGTIVSSTVKNNDGPVWRDDSVEILLSPDNGTTVYRFIYNAAGARYDARNGDVSFTNGDWKAVAEETPKYWTVQYAIPLNVLAGKSGAKKWRFNIIRNVRKQGFAKRQWCYLPGDVNSLGAIELLGTPVSPLKVQNRWSAGAGLLTLKAGGSSTNNVTLDYSITPLIHQKLLPEFEVFNKEVDTAEGTVHPEVIIGTKNISIPGKPLTFEDEISYTAKKAALVSVSLTDAGGAPYYSHSALVAPQSAVRMTIINLPTRDVMLAQLTLPSRKMVGPDVAAVVAVRAKGARTPYATKRITAFKDITAQAEFNVKELAFGPIECTAVFTVKGKKIGEVAGEFYHSDKPVWWDKHAGELTNVIPPWTPIVIRGDTAQLYIKNYSFKNSLLPTNVNILHDEILAAPMRLVIKSGGKVIDTLGAKLTLLPGPNGVRATTRGSKTDGNLAIDVNGFIEFDGFIWNDITITPSAEVTIDEIYFEAPFKKEFATVFNINDYGLFAPQPGAIPAEGFETIANWCIRMGSVERGIQFAPAFYKYPEEIMVVTDPKPIKVIPSGDTMVFKYVVLDKPAVFKKPVKLELGIIGLPTRPFDRRQRKIVHGGSGWYFDDMVKSGAVEKGYRLPYYFGAGWTGRAGGGAQGEDVYYHLPEKGLDAISDSWQENWKKYHWFTCCYTSPVAQDMGTREYACFQDEWRVTPEQAHLDETRYLAELKDWNGVERPPAPPQLVSACWASEGVQDYWMYCIDKAMKNFHSHGLPIGIYVDNLGAYKCNNPFHNHGYVDDQGVRRPKHEFLGQRQWALKLSNIMKSNDPESHTVIHMSTFRPMGLWSTVDILHEGEQFTWAWSQYMADKPGLNFNDCFPTIMPLDRFRATFARQLYGPDVAFLSQLWIDERQNENLNDNSNKQRLAPSRRARHRHLSGLAWVHDTPISGELEPISAYFKLIAWGWDEKVEFIGYWKTGGAYTLETSGEKEIAASVWYRPEGKLAAMIFNGTNKPQKTTLKINRDKFPVKLNSFTKAVDISRPDDILDKGKTESEEFGVQNLTITVDMRPRDYRFLVFE